MHPILYRLHWFGWDLEVHTYGLFIAVGCVAAVMLTLRRARQLGEDPELVQEACLWMLCAAMFGARMLYVVSNAPAFARACSEGLASRSASQAVWECTRALHVWEGGLVFYGGLVAGLVFVPWWARRHGQSSPRLADLLAPQVALGHFFGRLGCFAAGCCWGRPAAHGVSFPRGSIAWNELASTNPAALVGDHTVPLHAVQLYEAAGALALFVGLSRLATAKRYHGQVLVWYLGGYAVLRLATELVRGDPDRRFVVDGVSTSQLIAVATLALAVALAVTWRNRMKVA